MILTADIDSALQKAAFTCDATRSTSSDSIAVEMPPSSSASRLPFDVLHHIFLQLQVVLQEERGEYSHGGRLVGWDSNEALRSLPLVSRAWQLAANPALYHSIYLHGSQVANRLLATLKARPELAELVRRVAVGPRDEGHITSSGLLEASTSIVEVLNALPHLEHVLIRPLHPSVRPQFLSFFAARRRRLKSLVLVARDVPGGPRWEGLLVQQDLTAIVDGLEHLDLDIWQFSASKIVPLVHPPDQLRLTHLCLDSDCSPSFTYSLICDTLIHLHLYFEHLRPSQQAADALSKAANLRHLDYVCNPPVDLLDRQHNRRTAPVMDLLLPSLPLLETLHVSATDISPSFLRVLPPHLHRIIIQSYSSYGFEEPESLLDMLRRPSLDTKGLQELEIRDSKERWEDLEQRLVNVCARRGIRFSLVTSEDAVDGE